MDTERPRVGLALGSGSARGWSHIGIIQALTRMGIAPDIVCGCSIGAIVGAAHAAGNLDKLDTWVRSLTRVELARYFELNLSLNGFVDRKRLQAFFQDHVCGKDTRFDKLGTVFGTVATDLATGKEIWFQEGPVMDAIWASIALPGLFPPIQSGKRWLVDGGLVNPVPISLCRALGADIVIAVNLNGGMVGHHLVPKQTIEQPADDVIAKMRRNVRQYTTSLFGNQRKGPQVPNLYEAITGSLYIAQDRITRSRMAGDPPDILLTPRLADIGLLEFYRAEESIREGKACVKRLEAEIRYVVETRGRLT
jgi:NTE family protein